MRSFVVAALLLFAASRASAADSLRVSSAGPVGEVQRTAEANEIRVVFSEPMAVVGRVPKDLLPPWFRIAPAVSGTFRWSGTTTLIFTPGKPLPYATKYDVTIESAAKSIAGNTLERVYSFSFTSPTVKLQWASWYRKEAKADSAIVIGLFFNQPVETSAILPFLQMRTVPREFKEPTIPPSGTIPSLT